MTDFEEKEKVHDCLLFFVWFCFVVMWLLAFFKAFKVQAKNNRSQKLYCKIIEGSVWPGL